VRRKLHTSTRLENAPYPRASVYWTEDEDGNGWTGFLSVWDDPNSRREASHEIHLRQGSPLGNIYIDVDPVSGGAWAFSSFEGHGITERDLEWAALYAVEALKRKWDLMHH